MAEPLSEQQHLLMLNAYAPYHVEMCLRLREHRQQLKGVDFGIPYVLLMGADPEVTFYETTLNVTPVLYDLADVPLLPEREDDEGDMVRRLVSLVNLLNILGTGETVTEVEALRNYLDGYRPRFLRVLVHTTHTDEH